MIKNTRRNRRSVFAGFFTSNTMVGVQSSVLANVSAASRSAQVLRMQPETLLLEDRVMPVVNLSVSDLTIVEGDAGTKDALFTVTRSGDSNAAFTVDYHTEDGTAKAGLDYLENSGTLTFLEGENVKQVSVAVVGNNVLQVDRDFKLKLYEPKQLLGTSVSFGSSKILRNIQSTVGLVRAGDIDLDGKNDLIWRAIDGSNGEDGIEYYINGNERGYGSINIEELTKSPDITSLSIARIGQFNDIVIGCKDAIVVKSNEGTVDLFTHPKDSLIKDFLLKDRSDGEDIGGADNIQTIDIDKDGYIDILACNAKGLFFFRNNGLGVSFKQIMISNEKTLNISANDINGDGNIDIVALQGNGTNQKLVQFFGTGNNEFNSIIGIPLIGPSYSIVSADFNQDGFADLAVQSESSLELLVYPGSDKGLLSVPTQIKSFYLGDLQNINRDTAPFYLSERPTLIKSEIATGDFNKDGFPDIVVSGPVGILLSKGDFNFTNHGQSEQTKNHVPGSSPDRIQDAYRSVTVADINSDGIVDVITNLNERDLEDDLSNISNVKGSIVIDYINTESIIETPQFIGNTEVAGKSSYLTSADFNNDGILDFVTTGPIEYPRSVDDIGITEPRDLIFTQIGSDYPTFSNTNEYSRPIAQSLSVKKILFYQNAVADFNNDGNSEFIVRADLFKADNSLLSGYYVYDSPELQPGQDGFWIPKNIINLTTGDFNGPDLGSKGEIASHADIVTVDSTNTVVIEYHNGNYKSKTFTNTIPTAVGRINQIFTRDINLDGVDDIVLIGSLGLQTIMCYPKYDYTLSPVSSLVFSTQVNIADIGHDGILDLVGLDPNGIITYTPILSSGLSGLTTKVQTPSAFTTATAVDAADLNNDGHTDFIVFGPLQFIQMNLSGYDKTIYSPLGIKGPVGIADHIISDLNKDGLPDLLYSTYSGTATWLTNTSKPVTFKFITDTASGKINDDDIPATISIVSGDGQSTGINQPYIDPLSVIVKNANGTPVSGATVVFTANIGQNGSTGSFDTIPQITTNSSGIAVSPTLNANSKAGQFTVNATATDGTINPMIAFNLFSKMSMGFQTADVSVQEGDYGLNYLVLQVVRTGQTEYPGSVTYSTIDGSAKSGVDYHYVSTRLNFASSETSKKISIPIIGNTKLQLDRAFSIDFSDPYADPSIPWLFQIPKTPATVAIKDDDAPTKVVAQDGDNQKMGIGEAFLKPLTVIVQNINGNPVSGVSVSFQVSVGSNLATAKFANSNPLISDANGRAVSSQLTAGQIPGTFQVIATATGNGQTAIGKFNETVIPLIQYSVTDSSIIEGDSGTKQMVFTIRRGGSTSLVTTVDYSTVDGSAIAGTDYANTFGKLTFAANEIAKKVTVPIFTNTIFQSDRAFQFALSNPAWIPGQDIVFQTPVASAIGKITDDDNPQYISIVTGDQQSNSLGTDFATPLSVRVQNLNGSAVSGVPISFVVRPGLGDVNATFASSDVLLSDSTGTAVASRLTAGLTPGSFSVYATASGYLSNKTAIFQLTQKGKITYSMADSSVKEGDSGQTPMVFTITRSGSTWLDSSIDYKTVDGSALAGTDYEAASGRVYFAPNELTKTIRVNVIGNSSSQVDRKFGVALSLPAGINPQPNDLIIPAVPAQGTIMDDDSVIAAARFIKQSAPIPAPQPFLQSYTVQKGASSRSFVRYVDLVLNDASAATNLISSIASSAPRIRLTNKGLSGTSNSPVSLQGFAKSNGTSVKIDFGSKGLGGSPTTSTTDGSYLLEMDLDANGSYETSMRFHRLLGDVNGDKVVDSKDTSLANSSINKSGLNLPADTNGDGKVNATDIAYIRKAQKRKILV